MKNVELQSVASAGLLVIPHSSFAIRYSAMIRDGLAY